VIVVSLVPFVFSFAGDPPPLVAAGLPLAPMPVPLLIAAQVCVGFPLGARLRRAFSRVPRAGLAAPVGTMIFATVPVLPSGQGSTPPRSAGP
jgi:hypothetical protein